MQTFSRTGSRLGSSLSSPGSFGRSPFDPTSFQGTRQFNSLATFQQATSPFGTTQTLLGSSITQSSRFSLGPTPFETTLRTTLQVANSLSRQAEAFLLADPGRLISMSATLISVWSPALGGAVSFTGVLLNLSTPQAVGGLVGGRIGTGLGGEVGNLVLPGPGRIIGMVVGGFAGGVFGAQVGARFSDPYEGVAY